MIEVAASRHAARCSNRDGVARSPRLQRRGGVFHFCAPTNKLSHLFDLSGRNT